MGSSPSIDDLVDAFRNFLGSFGKTLPGATPAATDGTVLSPDQITQGLNPDSSAGTGQTQLQGTSYVLDGNGSIRVNIAARGFLIQQASTGLTFVLRSGQEVPCNVGQGWSNKDIIFQVWQIKGGTPGDNIRIVWGDSVPTSTYAGQTVETPAITPDVNLILNPDLSPWTPNGWPTPRTNPSTSARTATIDQALAVDKPRGGRQRFTVSGTFVPGTPNNGSDVVIALCPSGSTPGATTPAIVYKLRKMILVDPGGYFSDTLGNSIALYVGQANITANPLPSDPAAATGPLRTFSGTVAESPSGADVTLNFYDGAATQPTYSGYTGGGPTFVMLPNTHENAVFEQSWDDYSAPMWGGSDWQDQFNSLSNALIFEILGIPGAVTTQPILFYAEIDACVDGAAGNVVNGQVWS